MAAKSVDTKYSGTPEYQRNTAKNLRNTAFGNANGNVVDNSEAISAGRVIATSPQRISNLNNPRSSFAYPVRSTLPPFS